MSDLERVNDKLRRRSVRLKGYDYSRAGAYFVTICTLNRECLFGEIKALGSEPLLNECGEIALDCWNAIPGHFQGVELDEFVVMPNHVHGILIIHDHGRGTGWGDDRRGTANGDGCRGTGCDNDRRGTACRAPTTEKFGKPVAGSLPTIIRSFKSAVTKRIHERRGTSGCPVWHQNYYEHVVRDQDGLNRIREYILLNPVRWLEDENNPANLNADLNDSRKGTACRALIGSKEAAG